MSEEIYRNLTGEKSVHLSNWPKHTKPNAEETQLIADMRLARKVVETALAVRKEVGVKVRQPLAEMEYFTSYQLSAEIEQVIAQEVNVKKIGWKHGADDKYNGRPTITGLSPFSIDDELRAEGEVRELIRQVQELRKEKGARLDQKIKLTVPKVPQALDQLKRQTLAQEVVEGEKLWIELL